MRSKAVLSIVAFLSAFGISVAVTPRPIQPQAVFLAAPTVKRCASNPEVARKITTLLARDIENGRIRDRKISRFHEDNIAPRSEKGFANYAEAIKEYAVASANIDDTELPSDFRFAWREHLRVWQNHADFLEEMNNLPAKFSREKYYQNVSEQNREISETWFEVLRIARQYDAEIPAGAY